eukprot:2656674-Pyramimonas_sp.AAC.1
MAEQTHSTEVELLGVVWAAIFSLQLPSDEQACVICDNMAAVDKALSRVRLVSELDKMDATVLRDVQRVRPITVVQETRHFTKESNEPPALPEVPREALKYTLDAEWQFTRFFNPTTSPYPCFLEDGFHFDVRKQKLPQPDEHAEGKLAVSRAPTRINYKIATFNNVTICSGDDSEGLDSSAHNFARQGERRARARHLRLQLKDDSVLLAGIQETSHPAGKFETDGFLVVNTGSASKGLGCTLLVNLELGYARGKKGPMKLMAKHVH